MRYKEVCPGIYMIGGGGISSSNDCCVYLLDGGGKYALLDCGTGSGSWRIMEHLQELVKSVDDVQYIIITHGHIDHIGGLPDMAAALPQAKIVAHSLELDAIERGNPVLTAAKWYGIKYTGVPVDIVIEKHNHALELGGMKINCLHTPGHTPGGISPYLDWQGKRILFGQDIHGPFNEQWGSDLEQWEESMNALLSLKADILCEGHYGIIQPKKAVKAFIEKFLDHFA